MNFVFVGIGFLIGGVIAWAFSSLSVKLKMIPRSEYEFLNEKTNRLQTDLEVTNQKVASLQQDKVDLQKEIDQQKQFVTNAQKEIQFYERDVSALSAKLAAANETKESLVADLSQSKIDLKTKTDEFNELNKTAASLSAINRSLDEKLTTQKREIEELRKQFNLEFENIASKILDEKSDKFTKLNQDNLSGILKPLGENIDLFRKKVEEVYINEAKERFSLGEEVKKLQVLNTRLSEEATNLTNALTGSSKTQGFIVCPSDHRICFVQSV